MSGSADRTPPVRPRRYGPPSARELLRPRHTPGAQDAGSRHWNAWQLKHFRLSPKDVHRLDLLLELLGPLEADPCLMITCCSNSGALNFHLREAGGSWCWIEQDAESVPYVEELLCEQVHTRITDSLPFRDNTFARLVLVGPSADQLERWSAEILRTVQPDGVAIVLLENSDGWVLPGRPQLTPNGTANGEDRLEELRFMLNTAGLQPVGWGVRSRVLTEAGELLGTWLDRNLGSWPPGGGARSEEATTVAPKRLVAARRVVYPLLRLFSALDRVVPGRNGYTIAVAAQKADVRPELRS